MFRPDNSQSGERGRFAPGCGSADSRSSVYDAALELYLKKEMGSNKRMVNRRYTLSKEERLSWKRYIDLLFAKGQSFVAFPLRVVYLAVEEETLAPVSILVSVPKKNSGVP